MAKSGAVLKFPVVGKPDKSAAPIQHPGPAVPKTDAYDHDETVSLYQVASSVKNKAEDLIAFANQNRQIARQAGIELLTVQLTSILEGNKFQMVFDALEDAVYRRVPVTLTQDGLDKVHRMEKLISEADNVIVQFMTGRKVEPVLGQAAPQYQQIPYPVSPRQSDSSIWIPFVIVGVAGIVGIIAIIALTQRPRRS